MIWERRGDQWVKDTAVVIDREALERAARAVGVNETGRLAGCSGATVSVLINGLRTTCEVAIADRLAVVLELSRDKIFTIKTTARDAVDAPAPGTSTVSAQDTRPCPGEGNVTRPTASTRGTPPTGPADRTSTQAS